MHIKKLLNQKSVKMYLLNVNFFDDENNDEEEKNRKIVCFEEKTTIPFHSINN